MGKLGEDLFGNVSAPADDWPADYEMQFWKKWPSHSRKHSQAQVFDKLGRIRRDRGIKVKRVFVPATWDQIWAGVCAYVASNPERKFMPAPLVWINQARWTANYEPEKPAKMTLGDIMRGGIARHG